MLSFQEDAVGIRLRDIDRRRQHDVGLGLPAQRVDVPAVAQDPGGDPGRGTGGEQAKIAAGNHGARLQVRHRPPDARRGCRHALTAASGTTRPSPGLPERPGRSWGGPPRNRIFCGLTGPERPSSWQPGRRTRVVDSVFRGGPPSPRPGRAHASRPRVAPLAQIGRGLVGEHALHLADARDDGRHAAARLAREALVGHGLDELADPQSARVPRGAAGGQDVVGADALVGVGDGRLLADEERSVVAQAPEVPVVAARLDLEVLGRVLVGERGGRLVVAHDDDLAERVPCLARHLARAQQRELALDLAEHGLAERARRRDEHGGRVRAVLGLAQEVAGHHDGIGRIVGDDEDLGRTCEQVDADRAEDLPLGLGDVLVAGPDDHVHRAQRRRPVRHRGERLHAAEAVDLVGARRDHRVERRRVDAAVRVGWPLRAGRRAGDDAPDPGDAGGRDAHQRGGDQRDSVRPARTRRRSPPGSASARSARPAPPPPRTR